MSQATEIAIETAPTTAGAGCAVKARVSSEAAPKAFAAVMRVSLAGAVERSHTPRQGDPAAKHVRAQSSNAAGETGVAAAPAVAAEQDAAVPVEVSSAMPQGLAMALPDISPVPTGAPGAAQVQGISKDVAENGLKGKAPAATVVPAIGTGEGSTTAPTQAIALPAPVTAATGVVMGADPARVLAVVSAVAAPAAHTNAVQHAPKAAPATAAEVLEAAAATPHRAEQASLMAAAPGVLEVGLASTTHGWLRVRAELDESGQVSAQVLTASAGAAENLHKKLPAMTAYLATEQVGLSSLAVHAMEQSAGTQESGLGGGSDANAQSRQQQTDTSAGHPAQASGDAYETAFVSGLPAFWAGTGFGGAGSGGWLSVRV